MSEYLAMDRETARESVDTRIAWKIDRARQENPITDWSESVEIDEETAQASEEWWAQHCQPITEDWIAPVLARHPYAVCQSCHTIPGGDDPSAGWDIIDWDDATPGDIVWDGEVWQACRACNWDYENGHSLHIPEGAHVLNGCTISAVGAALLAAASQDDDIF